MMDNCVTGGKSVAIIITMLVMGILLGFVELEELGLLSRYSL